MKVFVGYDPREDIAYQVCKNSILRHSPTAEVKPLKQTELRRQGWYSRSEDKLASTEFTFTRFLVPELANFNGWAVFMDCDMLLGELSPEWNWLVGHYEEPKDGTPKLLHYTEGGPWFENYRDCDYNQEWKQELYDMFK